MHASAGGGGIGGALATAADEPQLPANQQTALRLAANAFQHPVLRQWIAAQVFLGPQLHCLTFASARVKAKLHHDCPSGVIHHPYTHDVSRAGIRAAGPLCDMLAIRREGSAAGCCNVPAELRRAAG